MFVRQGRLKVQRWDETSRVMPSSLHAFALYRGAGRISRWFRTAV